VHAEHDGRRLFLHAKNNLAEARRMPPTSPSCRSSHRPVSTHFRYDLNSGHFAGLRSLTSWARSDQTPLDAPV